MNIFKENNPQVLKSILEYWNEQHKSEGDIESNNDFTQEINDTKDDDVDYKFYYENVLQWNWKEQQIEKRNKLKWASWGGGNLFSGLVRYLGCHCLDLSDN